jgi:hypothetical protein
VTVEIEGGNLDGPMCVVGAPAQISKVPDFSGASPIKLGNWADAHGIPWRIPHIPPLVAGDRARLLDNYVVVHQSLPVGSTAVTDICHARSSRHPTWLEARVQLRSANS